MINNIEKMAAAFLSMGIKQGDCVTVCLPNVPEIIYAVYSLNRIGAIASLIDPRTNANEILKRANDSNSKVLIVITNIVKAKIDPIISELKAESVICVSPFNSFESKLIDALSYRKNSREGKYINYNEFLKRGKNVQLPEQIPFVKNSPAVIVYTSGTTENSKGVMLSNENIVSSHRISSFGCSAVQENASFWGVIPFFVSYGAITGMNYSLCSGWKIILITKFKANQFTKLILKHKPNSVLGVPRFGEHFADKNTNVDLSFLKNPICGGDKISPLSVQKINLYLSKHKANRLKIGYGASEFGGGIVITTEHGPYDINSTG